MEVSKDNGYNKPRKSPSPLFKISNMVRQSVGPVRVIIIPEVYCFIERLDSLSFFL
jgi:hypothetical protein